MPEGGVGSQLEETQLQTTDSKGNPTFPSLSNNSPPRSNLSIINWPVEFPRYSCSQEKNNQTQKPPFNL